MNITSNNLRSVQLEIVQAAALLCDMRQRPEELDVSETIDSAIKLLDKANEDIHSLRTMLIILFNLAPSAKQPFGELPCAQ